jgi:hypothetical protein
MTTLQVNRTAAQLPSVTDFDEAIRNARFALHSGPLDWAISHLKKASRIAGAVGNPHAPEPAVETLKLVEMCFLDVFPEQ